MHDPTSMSPPVSSPPHLHGALHADLQRLRRMNEFINAANVERLRLAGGEKILEVQSGLGLFAREMARESRARAGPRDNPKVVCIETHDELIYRSLELATSSGEDHLLDVRQGKLEDPPLLDDEWGTFDLVHCRFVLGQIEQPQAVVETLARALRPGGRMVLLDDDHDLLRLWPPLPAVEELWRAMIRAFSDRGTDPFLGRKLVAMMRVADLTPVTSDHLFFGGCAGEARWEFVTQNLLDILHSARQLILQSSAIARDLFDEVLESLRDWTRRADSALWYPACIAEAMKPL